MISLEDGRFWLSWVMKRPEPSHLDLVGLIAATKQSSKIGWNSPTNRTWEA